MKVKVYPSLVSGSITPPPSKSYLHRCMICAALANGVSKISNVIYSQDVLATLGVIESLGVKVTKDFDSVTINSPGLSVLDQEMDVYCNESGSTIRFFIPILSNSHKAYFKGKSGLMKRPFDVYKDIFKEQGLFFEQTVNYVLTKGKLKAGNYKVPGNISSQFISGLLFILPTLSGDSTIEITGNYESSEYVDMTVDILESFGIEILFSDKTFFIKGNQIYNSNNIFAETDYSQAAFFAVLGMINNNIQVKGLNSNSLQPDRKIIDFLSEMSGSITKTDEFITFEKSLTKGITIDISQSPDIGPILGILAACSSGTTNIINARRLVIKESNRLLSTFETLKKLGVNVSMGEDYLTIHGAKVLRGGTYDSYNDHRIVMSLAIVGTVCQDVLIIEGAEAVNKSYPSFFEDLRTLGVKIDIEVNDESN